MAINTIKIKDHKLYVFGLLIFSQPFFLSVQANDIAPIDELVQQWINIDRQAVELSQQWQHQKPLLKQRIRLLQAERNQLDVMLRYDNTNQSDVESQRVKFLEEQTDIETHKNYLEQALEKLSNKLILISNLLPPAIKTDWQNEQAQLGDSPQTSLKLQVALAQLSKINEFNQRVSVHEMSLITPSGVTVLVKQIYLGTGAAWFSSQDGNYAGFGHANKDAWIWTFDEAINSSEILKAIAIFEKQQSATLVHLPLLLNHFQPTSAIERLAQ